MTDYDVVIWSAGNHPTNDDIVTRHGVHNATIVEKEIFGPTCVNNPELPWLPLSPDNSAANKWHHPRLFWMSMHVRRTALSPDEDEVSMVAYSQDSLQAIKRTCGQAVESIDVINMTRSLVHDLEADAKRMTWDGAHWSRAVNLVKAQIILQAIT
jgi:hypothetical protein